MLRSDSNVTAREAAPASANSTTLAGIRRASVRPNKAAQAVGVSSEPASGRPPREDTTANAVSDARGKMRRVLTTLPDHVRQAAGIRRIPAPSRESSALSNDGEQ